MLVLERDEGEEIYLWPVRSKNITINIGEIAVSSRAGNGSLSMNIASQGIDVLMNGRKCEMPCYFAVGDVISIGGVVTVLVQAINFRAGKKRVLLGISAPRDVNIRRDDVRRAPSPLPR